MTGNTTAGSESCWQLDGGRKLVQCPRRGECTKRATKWIQLTGRKHLREEERKTAVRGSRWLTEVLRRLSTRALPKKQQRHQFRQRRKDISSFLMVKESTENTAVLRSLVEVGIRWRVVTPPTVDAGIRLSSARAGVRPFGRRGDLCGSEGHCNAGML